MKITKLKPAILVTALASSLGFLVGTASADNLTVALAAEPTSMDPHYQNLTINNSFKIKLTGLNRSYHEFS